MIVLYKNYDGVVAAVVSFAALIGLARRTFPKEPLKILPFFVFLSPLPIIECLVLLEL